MKYKNEKLVEEHSFGLSSMLLFKNPIWIISSFSRFEFLFMVLKRNVFFFFVARQIQELTSQKKFDKK